MTYTRYVSIRAGSSASTVRPIPGAVSADCVLLGRERGGLCLSASLTIPAGFPSNHGVRIGDHVMLGYDNTADGQWWHGYVSSVRHQGLAANLMQVEAVGYENQLRAIFPRVNFGSHPANPYATYDNPSVVSVGDIVQSLFDTYIENQGAIIGVASASDIDATLSSTDVEYLDYDGSTSLYDILNSLAERTGFSWGFDPRTLTLTNHTFFFKERSGVYNPADSKFTIGTGGNVIDVSEVQSLGVAANEIDIVGSTVPKIGQEFKRRYVNPSSQTTLTKRALVRHVPGIQTTNDATVHAEAINARRAAPNSAFQIRALSRNLSGELIFPGQTRIEVVSGQNLIVNPLEKYTYEMRVSFIQGGLEMQFVLGELPERLSSEVQGAIKYLQGIKTPKLYSYSGSAYSESQTLRNPVDRRARVALTGTVEAKDTDDETVDVYLGDDDQDQYRELYTAIPIPAAVAIANVNVGDSFDVEHLFEDGELVSVALAQVGGGSVSSAEVIAIVNHGLATGTVAIYNTTKFKDIEDHNPTGTGDEDITPGDATYAEARLGHLLRVPAADNLAITTNVHAIASASYSAANPSLPATATNAKLFGRILGITSGGEIGLGELDGALTTVKVKTGAAEILEMEIANDGANAAPYGAILRPNTV